MTRKWKQTCLGVALAVIASTVSGCGGIAASPSVSPASLLLPGLISVPVHEPSPEPAPADWDQGITNPDSQLTAS